MRRLALILAIGLALRLSVALTLPFANAEGVLFAWMGLDMAGGHGLTIAEGTSLSDARAWHMPLYPSSLALAYSLLGTGLLVSRLVSVAFGMGTVVLAYLLGRRMGGESVGLITAALTALQPLLAFTSADLLSEAQLTFSLLLYLYLLLEGRPLPAGLALGMAYLTRHLGLLFLPGSVLYLLYTRRPRSAAALAGGFLLLALPWWAWSTANYGTPFAPEHNSLLQVYRLEYGYYPADLDTLGYLGMHDPFGTAAGLLGGLGRLLALVAAPLDYPGILPLPLKLVYAALWSLPALLGMARGGRALNLLFLATVGGGLLGTAWPAHVIPPLDNTPFRYTAPYIPILALYASLGLKSIPKYGRPLLGAVLLLNLALVPLNLYPMVGWAQELYGSALEGVPKDIPILASTPTLASNLGYRPEPLGDMDFQAILGSGARYLVVDSSSLNNDHQLYLVNYWYKERIPPRIRRVRGDYPVSLYEIAPD